MALITKLSSAFTDTSLPILQKDPVIPNAGGIVLLDFKNLGCHPTQGSTISSYTQLVNAGWATLTPSGTISYNSTTGRATSASGTGIIYFDNTSGSVFSSTTANYCLSAWLYLPDTLPGGYPELIVKGTGLGNTGNNTFSLYSRTTGTFDGFEFGRPSATGNALQNLASMSPANGTVYRFGYAWSKNSGTWQHKSVVNNGNPTAWTNSTFGTGADGVQNRSERGEIRLNGDIGIYRFYLENLTLSGRTPEQVWAADWARGNGRFS